MEMNHGTKRKFNEDVSSDTDSDQSVKSYLYLGDVENTLSDKSTSDSKDTNTKGKKGN